MSRRRSVVMLCGALLAGCGDEAMTAGDAQVPMTLASQDASSTIGVARTLRSSMLRSKTARRDAALPDAGERDGAVTDVAVADDRPAIDAGADVPRSMSPASMQARRTCPPRGTSRTRATADLPPTCPPTCPVMSQRSTCPRSTCPATCPRSTCPATDVPRDVPVDVSSCTGAGPVLTVGAPTSGQEIETCTTGGLPVFFDFTASVTASSPVRSVGARWLTPDGLEAPPPASLSAAPYVFRRQVGGPSAGAPALSVFGIRGNWRVEFTAVDACGRSTTASQTFSLIFTSRRCPNP
jgi:hypothetical protein